MATVARAEETDSLASLEERIVRAVQLVSQLRQEKEEALLQVDKLRADRTSVDGTVAELQDQNARLTEELDSLRSDRKQVRSRIEKLLGQMDLLGAN